MLRDRKNLAKTKILFVPKNDTQLADRTDHTVEVDKEDDDDEEDEAEGKDTKTRDLQCIPLDELRVSDLQECVQSVINYVHQAKGGIKCYKNLATVFEEDDPEGGYVNASYYHKPTDDRTDHYAHDHHEDNEEAKDQYSRRGWALFRIWPMESEDKSDEDEKHPSQTQKTSMAPGATTPVFPVEIAIRYFHERNNDDELLRVRRVRCRVVSPLLSSKNNKPFYPFLRELQYMGDLIDFLYLHLATELLVVRSLITYVACVSDAADFAGASVMASDTSTLSSSLILQSLQIQNVQRKGKLAFKITSTQANNGCYLYLYLNSDLSLQIEEVVIQPGFVELKDSKSSTLFASSAGSKKYQRIMHPNYRKTAMVHQTNDEGDDASILDGMTKDGLNVPEDEDTDESDANEQDDSSWWLYPEVYLPKHMNRNEQENPTEYIEHSCVSHDAWDIKKMVGNAKIPHKNTQTLFSTISALLLQYDQDAVSSK